MRLLSIAIAALAATAAAQSATVTNNADAGAGSLREALLAANSSPGGIFTISIDPGATTGAIALGSPLPVLTRSDVTFTAAPGAGRLVVDAQAVSIGGSALELNGNNIQLLAPLRMQSQGNGVVVRGAGTRLMDLEVLGNHNGVGLGGYADDLTVDRILVDAFVFGIVLQDCHRARIADGGALAEVSNCSAPGFQINNGGEHTLGAFVCTADLQGISATNCPNLRLGGVGLPRAQVTLSPQQGILLVQCNNAVLVNADMIGNGAGGGGSGVQVIGGVRFHASDLRLESNGWGGMLLEGGLVAPRIGPGVTTRGLNTLTDTGLIIRHATAVTVVDCTFGPNHSTGVRLEPDSGGASAEVAFCGCNIVGNRLTGFSMLTGADTRICSSQITGNQGDGIAAVGASLAAGPSNLVVADCVVSSNAGNGVFAANVNGVLIGPGNHCDDNIASGLRLFWNSAAVVRDNLSIDRNRGSGIFFHDCSDAVVARTQLRDNRGNGIWAAACARPTIGPDVVIRSTLGNGVTLEGSDGARIVSTQVTDSSVYGMMFSNWQNYPATTPHVLQSCLLADNQGIAILQNWSMPVICQWCTIAGNLRGVDSGPNPMTIDSCIVYANLIEDMRPGIGLTVLNSFHLNPPPAGSNSNADPCFMAPAQRDWRIQPWSPAVGFANSALVVNPGELDAYDGPRSAGVGTTDAGAYEVGPHGLNGDTHLSLASTVMAHGGGGLPFQVQYAPNAVGTLSLLLLQLGTPSGAFPLLGAMVPIESTPYLLLAATDPQSRGTLALVPPGGLVTGALLWGGEIPASVQNMPISLCAIALDGMPSVRAVSDVATFTIQ